LKDKEMERYRPMLGTIKSLRKSLRLKAPRLFTRFFVALFAATILAQILPLAITDAVGGQITTRSITMSTSAASAQAEYSLTFTPATSEPAASLVVDFCANDPLISDTCTFAAGTVPTVASGIISSVGTAGVLGSGSPIHTISVTTIALVAASPITINFDVTPSNKLTNPTTNTSFYARVVTFNGNTAATSGSTTGYVPAATTGLTPQEGTLAIDTGGIALSTNANINITSNVFETLSFCVFQTSCGTAPVLTLGSSTTGALSTSSAYDNSNAQYTIATNAGQGAAVTMTGTTLCRPGGTCATGVNAYTIQALGAAQLISATGTEQFGMCADTTGVTGTLAAQAPYSDTINNCHSLGTGVYAGSSKFGFNDSAGANGTNNAAGTLVLKSTTDIPTYTGTFTFLGNIAATTAAGIYTTSLNLVATGTF
jgi:hypothetical protein